jgi:YgiT-type zinc finger domain-containing protein|tara:strand:+ start:234 stop:686 length:453 start_codon:yes stop_codon:yes gene_type:complete
MSATRNKFSPEFRDRAVRMVAEHRGDYPSEWAAMTSIAGKIGCTTETLRRWCREEASRRVGPATLAVSDLYCDDGSETGGDDTMKCPMCGGAELEHDTRDLKLEAEGQPVTIHGVEGDYCPACGEGVFSEEQSGRILEALQKSEEGPTVH